VNTAPTKSATPVVACRGLTKVFRDFWMRARVRAVDNVTFEIAPGEIFGLLGPNGSGKSTTIKIILGLLHKTRGQVAVFGKSPSDVAVKKRIGYLPEESYLYPFLNARETLEYYAKLFELDYRVRNRRIDELLDMVGLTAVQHRPVREYSKGMQRRIGIAQALINDPELLILDEPTTGLDPIGTRQIKDLILALGRRGKTVILSSHLLSDVEDCVDRMIILYGGKIRAEGTCDQLLTTEDQTILEFEPLDEATISEIDRIVRERTGGEKSLLRVAKPRQKLEDLFVDIVERARAERVETAGAQHGGRTAAFLQGDGAELGEQLISKLVAGDSAADAAPTSAGAPPQPTAAPQQPSEPENDVLKTLLAEANPEPQPAKAPEPSRPATAAPIPADVDQSVIGSLLGDGAPGNDGGSRQEHRP